LLKELLLKSKLTTNLKIMKKNILSIAILAMMVFVGCGDDDDGSSTSCTTCELTVSSVTTSTEYCDKGDGTIDITINGFTSNVDLGGTSYDDYIDAIELSSTCN